jgi:hypothetical protein
VTVTPVPACGTTAHSKAAEEGVRVAGGVTGTGAAPGVTRVAPVRPRLPQDVNRDAT